MYDEISWWDNEPTDDDLKAIENGPTYELDWSE